MLYSGPLGNEEDVGDAARDHSADSSFGGLRDWRSFAYSADNGRENARQEQILWTRRSKPGISARLFAEIPSRWTQAILRSVASDFLCYRLFFQVTFVYHKNIYFKLSASINFFKFYQLFIGSDVTFASRLALRAHLSRSVLREEFVIAFFKHILAVCSVFLFYNHF